MYIAKIIYINCKLIHVNYQLIVKHFDIDVSNVKKKSYLKILCYVWLLFTKTEKLEFLWWEIQLRRLSFWKTMALKRKWWRLLTEVKEWMFFSKLFSRDSKMISSNEALKSQWPNKETLVKLVLAELISLNGISIKLNYWTKKTGLKMNQWN